VLSDSHSYSETMAVIDAMEPNEVPYVTNACILNIYKCMHIPYTT
jgi:hypothetical protein